MCQVYLGVLLSSKCFRERSVHLACSNVFLMCCFLLLNLQQAYCRAMLTVISEPASEKLLADQDNERNVIATSVVMLPLEHSMLLETVFCGH